MVVLFYFFFFFFFFFNDTATTEIYTAQYTLSLHDALPIPYTAAGPTTTASSAATTGAEAPCCPTGATGKDHDCRYGGRGPSAAPGCESPPWNCGQVNADPGSADCPRARVANRLIGTNATRTASAAFHSMR